MRLPDLNRALHLSALQCSERRDTETPNSKKPETLLCKNVVMEIARYQILKKVKEASELAANTSTPGLRAFWLNMFTYYDGLLRTHR